MVQEYWDRRVGQAVRQMVAWDRGGMLPSVWSSRRAAQGGPGQGQGQSSHQCWPCWPCQPGRLCLSSHPSPCPFPDTLPGGWQSAGPTVGSEPDNGKQSPSSQTKTEGACLCVVGSS